MHSVLFETSFPFTFFPILSLVVSVFVSKWSTKCFDNAKLYIYFLNTAYFAQNSRQCDPSLLSCRFRNSNMVCSIHSQTEGTTCLYRTLLAVRNINMYGKELTEKTSGYRMVGTGCFILLILRLSFTMSH